MKKLDRSVINPPHAEFPERVLQFGEGNFLRAFVDWMIHRLNSAGLFNGSVVAVQPISQGMAKQINAQNGLYTLLLRGVMDGKRIDTRELISSISRAIDPYSQFESFLQCARNPELRVIVSNTTEAGIVFRPQDKFDDRPQASFPGKLTRFMFERFESLGRTGARGFIVLPCELIDRNGDVLRAAVLDTARNWALPASFIDWITSANTFANTLVDRIVSGYPRDEAPKLCQELGYDDALLVAGEPFHFWAIEADPAFAAELPFEKAGLNVVWTNDMTPYRQRKVRILNGAHTMMVPAAFLMGLNTVGQCMNDDLVRGFLHRGLQEEIIPTLDLPADDLAKFAATVMERFANPFVQHNLTSITLNSISKFKARVLPSILEYIARRKELPRRLAFSMAALIAFYRGTEMSDGALIGRRGDEKYRIQDDPDVLEFFKTTWNAGSDIASVVRSVLSRTQLWGEDLTLLPRFADLVTQHLQSIIEVGPRKAMDQIQLGKNRTG